MPKALWVFDTVSLSNFMLAGAEKLLARRYAGRAIVPWEVFDEVLRGQPGRPALAGIHALVDNTGFALVTVSKQERGLFVELLTNLGAGEAACIALAKARRATVVTDDRAARRACVSHGLAVTGTIGILRAACVDKQTTIGEADAILGRMVDSGFYSPVRSIADLL